MEPYFDRVKPRHLTGEQLDLVLSRGWYRMRQDLFTISHLAEEFEFYRVHWLRYQVDRIKERKSHKRIRYQHNKHKVVIEPLGVVSQTHRDLHRKYRKWIDFDGVHTIEEGLFGEEGQKNIFNTWSLSIYKGEQLIAAGYFDIGKNSVASILHFFDPDYSKTSPGKFLILSTLDFMKEQGIEWYYPGYVVAGRPKMDYKLFLGREFAEYFNPQNGLWSPFNSSILLEDPIIIPVAEDLDDEPIEDSAT